MDTPTSEQPLLDEQPERIATIHPGHSLRPGSMMIHRITFTVNGTPAGQSLARADELKEWHRDLAEGGWTIAENPTENTVENSGQGC